MLLIGGYLVWNRIDDDRRSPQEAWDHQPGATAQGYYLLEYSELQSCGPALLLMAGALALTLAVMQFFVPGLAKTWPFTVHRAASREMVLLSKVAAAAVGLSLAVGGVWTVLFLWASRPGALHYMPEPEVLAEGWVMIAAAFVVYVGAAVSALSAARWYTTRIFPLAFGVLIAGLSLFQTGIAASLAWLAIGLVILAAQLLHRFLNGEF